MGLNTVQVCDREDEKGGLLLGKHQYVLERTPRVEVIVVMHHPPEWIKDRHEAFQYLDSRARVHVFGHEHMQEIHCVADANQDMRLVIASGALTPEHARDPYIYRYNVIEFALGENSHDRLLRSQYFLECGIFNYVLRRHHSRLRGRESAKFALPCPQFRLPASGAQSLTSAVPSENEEKFVRVGYFFWRFLNWQQQLKVLVETDILPTTPSVPRLQTVAHMALERARADGKLSQLWEKIMVFVPVANREPNPFTNP